MSLLPNPLKLFGKLGKGVATIAGVVVGTGALATGAVLPSFALDPSLLEALQLVLEIIAALGGLLAVFGFGRKTGYAVPDSEK